MSDLQLEQHVSGPEENGDTVGYRWIIDADHSLWIGEISRHQFDELPAEEQDAYGNDFGCFYVLYGAHHSVILGRAPDLYFGRDIGELIALGLADHPSRMKKLLAD